jgi:hypothetical protein
MAIVILGGVFFFVNAVGYDRPCRLALFTEERCDGGNLGTCISCEVVKFMVLHGPFRSGLVVSWNSLDEASKEIGLHQQ